jgi:glyoxylase-like metal-dependent hydrolase (beta-lactamase superfamily II)
MLGREESCLYVIRGDREDVLLGGGLTYIIPDLERQFTEFGLDETRIRYIVIHHTHFDHVGVIPYLKKRWPWARVIASLRGREQLQKPKIMTAIRDMNRLAMAYLGFEDAGSVWGLDQDRIDVEYTPADGEELDLGGVRLRFLYTPGHSACSMAVYIPELKALAPSDSGGVPYGRRVFAAANSDFDLYEASLERMSELDVETYLAEHYGAQTGDDGRDFVARSLQAARETRRAILEAYGRTGDVGQTVALLTTASKKDTEGHFLPPEIRDMVMTRMVLNLVRQG